VRGVDAESIPRDPRVNSAGAVLRHLARRLRLTYGFNVEIEKGIPPGKGLGSSGASAAAAAYAALRLLGLRLPIRELVRLAALGEEAVSGSPHADNVSASLLGGFTIVSGDYRVLRLDPPEVEITIAVPEVHYESKTKLARELLPREVELERAVANLAYASKMAAAAALGDARLFAESICDRLIEPHRARMIPNFHGVKKAALEAGALGCSIAGGGPSVFAVGGDSREVGRAMANAFKEAGVECILYYTKPSCAGVRMLDELQV